MDAITDGVRHDQTQDLFFTFTGAVPDLVVTGFAVEESVSGLFCIDLALASERSDIDLTQLIDRPGLLTVHDRHSEPRHFHGVVESAERGDAGHRHTLYHLTLMPSLHRLRFGSDSRIFQQKSVIEIVESVLKENGITDFAWAVKEKHEPREYCVQYRETHLAFVERLLAEEGLTYFFEHTEKGHTLVMSDATVLARDVPVTSTLEYNVTAGGDVKGPHIRRFTWRERVRPSKVSLKDHSFKHPHHHYLAEREASTVNGLTRAYAMYDYPGRHKADGVGNNFTRYRLEGYRAEASQGEGEGRCAHLSPGHRFALKEHDATSLNRKYLVLSVSHHGTQATSLEEDVPDEAPGERQGQREGTVLTTAFRVQAADVPYRPEQLVKPVVDGPQMAHVVGPPGEEIFCDEHGRIKVQFPWDRYGKSDDKSSCWIRVAQNWAGGAWGHIAIPRIGQHVIVDFLEGDPDQPIVTGRAYHAVNPPPYTLPNHKTRMTIKSKTHKGTGFNELRFEDEKGQEEVFMHAQKDMTVHVKFDRQTYIGNNETQKIFGQARYVYNQNKYEYVKGDKHIFAGNASFTTGMLSGAYDMSNYPQKFLKDVFEDFQKHTGNGNITLSADGGLLISGTAGVICNSVGGYFGAFGGVYSVTSLGMITFNTSSSLHTSVKKRNVIDVGEEIIIQCGESSLRMKSNGEIEISGSKIKLSAAKINLN